MFSEFRPHCCLELRRPFSPSNTITLDRSSESLRAVSVSDTNSWKPGIRMQATGQSMHDGNSNGCSRCRYKDNRENADNALEKTRRQLLQDIFFSSSFCSVWP